MYTKIMLASSLSIVLLFSGAAYAADQERDQDREQDEDQIQTQDRIYGSQLMTEQERKEFRERIRAAKSAEERKKIRQQHHEMMQERAKAKGLKLPDEPPCWDDDMMPGRGMGPGAGMQQGGGMGKCGGR